MTISLFYWTIEIMLIFEVSTVSRLQQMRFSKLPLKWKYVGIEFLMPKSQASSNVGNPRVRISDRYNIILDENYCRWRWWASSWALGTRRIIADVTFAFSDLENFRVRISDRYNIIWGENSCRWCWWSSSWAPSTR